MSERIPDIDFPTRLPRGGREGSILKDETWQMENMRRAEEKNGHRKLGVKIHEREHHEEQHAAPEGELQNNIKEHPWINNQRYDGIDPNENPVPDLNTDADREFKNKQREQNLEKQLRLGLMPKMGSAPEPKP